MRKVMRALVMSYGDISMRTLSPTTILMKRLRILPEIWANTSCPLAKRTLNMVPAKTAQTVPSRSI